MPSLDAVTAGFLPLTDSSILVAAREIGFAEEEGIALSLLRETSWANIRDRMAVGHFDAAHMLAPMPIAANLGLTPLSVPLIAPMAMGLGGNAVTVSSALWDAMLAAGAGHEVEPAAAGRALRQVVDKRRDLNAACLRFGVVHTHSGHNFELRYWLAASGIVPDRDIEIVILPPPLMADALASGRIDGFCVGEPWNSAAIATGAGRIVTLKAAIWRSSPEKVLGVRSDWAEAKPDLLARLIRALYRSAEWCGKAGAHARLSEILSGPDYLNQPARLIRRALEGRLEIEDGTEFVADDFFLPFQRAATFPWQSHALWFYSQMVRWRQVAHDPRHAETARLSFRPDIYRSALDPLGDNLPDIDMKVEGAQTGTPEMPLGPDGFFDGILFDPGDLDAYIQTQAG